MKLGAPMVVAVTDRGSGIDPASLVVHVDGEERAGRFRPARSRLDARPRQGQPRAPVQVSDYQETRNMENVGRILPNTRILQTTFVVP